MKLIDIVETMKKLTPYKKKIKRLVEVFWEYQDVLGASVKDKKIALDVQEILGYKTRYDEARMRSAEL